MIKGDGLNSAKGPNQNAYCKESLLAKMSVKLLIIPRPSVVREQLNELHNCNCYGPRNAGAVNEDHSKP